MDIINSIISYEQGDLSASDTLDLFAHLIKTGQAWTLQGSYGRAANALIERGLIDPSGNITDAGRIEAAEFDDEDEPELEDPCSQCGEQEADEHGMCPSCRAFWLDES